MYLKAVENRFILKPYVEEKKEEGLILIPESSKKKTNDLGVVVEAPKDSEILEGTIVLFDVYEVKRTLFQKQEYIIAKPEDILALVECEED